MSKKLTTKDLLRMAREETARLQREYDEALRIQRILGNAVLAIARKEHALAADRVAARAYLECWPESKDVPGEVSDG